MKKNGILTTILLTGAIFAAPVVIFADEITDQQGHVAPVESANTALMPLVAQNTQAEQAYVQSDEEMNQPKPLAQNSPSATMQTKTVVKVDTSHMTVEQRLARLEQQLTNMQAILSQADQSQQLIQELQGRLDMQAHQLKVMQAQQRDIYQDLDHRLSQLAKNDNTTVANAQPNKIAHIGHVETDLKQQDVYEHAYGYIRNKQYPQAINAMQTYLKAYPEGKFAVNAHYWLGELFLVTGDNNQAKMAFQIVVDKYPKQPKVADALLKLAGIAAQTGESQQARKLLLQVTKDYPGSPAAQLAQQQLQQLT